jgi:DNA-binding NtrC family response regulator
MVAASALVVLPAQPREETALMPTVPSHSADHAPSSKRTRDRRRSLGDLVAAVARTVTIASRAEPGQLRTTFEETLKQIVPVHAAILRDGSARWPATRPHGNVDAVAFEVAGAAPAQRGFLEAVFDRTGRLGDWDFQLLGQAAQLGTLVLELERTRSGAGARAALPAGRERRDGAAPLIGSTPLMSSLRARIERVAQTDFTVLLEGESGVGKELVARQIHELSRRRNGPFLAINCAALVETLLEAELFGIEERTATGVKGRRGKFEHADGGTLFLDEVSDLSLSAQAKLLRAIQDLAVERVGSTGTQRVDIRIVAATNRGLREMVERTLFRADLYYRLGGVDLRVPPLRERRSDILELAVYFLERHRQFRTLRLSDAARDALMLYDWPGNVRELERTIERAVALAEADVIELDDLPPIVRGEYGNVLIPSLQRADSMRAWGSRYARLVLDRCDGNKREASRLLGISYHTLNSYLRFPLGIVGDDEEAAIDDAGDGRRERRAEEAAAEVTTTEAL